jgi:hypothetical protein
VHHFCGGLEADTDRQRIPGLRQQQQQQMKECSNMSRISRMGLWWASS